MTGVQTCALPILVDNLTLPSLAYLAYDIEARDFIGETITTLISCSNNPPLATLLITYNPGTAFYYGTVAGIMNWGFLMDAPELRTLKVGGMAFIGRAPTPLRTKSSFTTPAKDKRDKSARSQAIINQHLPPWCPGLLSQDPRRQFSPSQPYPASFRLSGT